MSRLEKGYISKYLEYNVPCYLTPKEQEAYDHYTKQIQAHLRKFGSKMQLHRANLCLSGGKGLDGVWRKNWVWCNVYAQKLGNWYPGCPKEVNDIWNPNKLMGYAKNLMKYIKLRKDILYNTPSKGVASLDIIQKFNENKTIVFSQSTAFADKLDLRLNELDDGMSVAYHSNLLPQMLPSPKTGNIIKFGQKRLKDRAIDRIRSNKSRVICTASALDVGFNVEDMNMAIVASGTSNPNQRQQRKGRVARLDLNSLYPQDEIVLMINLYVPNTKDEDWLKESQKRNKNVIYWVDGVDDLNYNPTKRKVFNLNKI